MEDEDLREDFIPIILGTDINAYGTARSFHEAYGLKSRVLGSYPLSFTQHSSICQVETTKGFNTDEIFLKVMLEKGREWSEDGKKLLVMPCSDGYTELMTRNKEALKEYFVFNLIDEDKRRKLENKIDFYNMCEEYGLDYPDTYVVNKEDFDRFMMDQFPVALKANDSIEYEKLDFEGKKKAYKIESQDELQKTLERIYNSGYSGEMIIQDFIPGDSDKMAVVNFYVNQHGKVTFGSFGKCILDEVLPESIGNYNAIISQDHPEIYEQYKKFLEEIDYRGFANFDLKYDERDGKFKVFEINIRQGRASYYINAGGGNYTKPIVEDLVEQKEIHHPEFLGKGKKLWLYCDPSLIKKYASREDYHMVKEYLDRKDYEFTIWYKNDRNFWRWLNYWRRRIATIRYYPKFFVKN